MSHITETPADTIWRFGKILLKLLLILGVVGLIFLAFVAWRIRESFPEIHPVPAPVAWVTRDVVLSAEAPVVRGQLVLTSRSVPTEPLRIGVNAGAPAAGPIASPGALLTGPTVRIATEVAQGQGDCFAPCELQLRPTWDCDPGDCRMAASFSLTLSVDAAGMPAMVTIGIAGGITANLEDDLPPGLQATLELGDDVAPGAS